jgi:Calcineurin-like phosphoesterase
VCENDAEETEVAPDNDAKAKRKDLGNFVGPFHSALASHFHAAGSKYSQTTYSPLKAFLPDHFFVWSSHVAKYWFQKKHNFRDYTAPGKGNGVHEIADHTSISLMGDWGTGTDEAQMVATSVAHAHPDFTIHLGDVYYVGGGTEVKENFLGEKTSGYTPVKWPMGAKGSFALTGNHEMYAHGNGYFRYVLPKMGLKDADNEWGGGQWASFFCLQNRHWRIVGIDTGYNSTQFDWGRVPVIQENKFVRTSLRFKPKCTLPPELMKWIETTVNPDGDNRGLILLSHHGAYSSFGEWYRIPAMQLAKCIHRPVIWFWGHEHKLAIYDKYSLPDGITSYGRCIGHGGMPVERGTFPDIEECRWLAWDNRSYRNGEDLDAGYNGYANIVLDGPWIHIEYRDLHGELLLTEKWRVDLNSGALEGPHLEKILDDPSLHFRAPV